MSRPPGIRTCIVCGRKQEKAGMLRLVVDSDGHVVIDTDGRMPGRGVYVCRGTACRKGLSRVKQTRWNRLFRRGQVVFNLGNEIFTVGKDL